MQNLKPLETTRLILNNIDFVDAQFYLKLFSTDDVMKYYGGKKFTTLQDSINWIERIHQKFANQNGFRYAIRLKTGQVIGSFGVNRILQTEGIYGVEVGYDLSPEYWNRGYMSEVLACILLELKQFNLFSKKISFVIAEVFDGNFGSMKILKQQNFVQVLDNTAEQIRLGLEVLPLQVFKLNLN